MQNGSPELRKLRRFFHRYLGSFTSICTPFPGALVNLNLPPERSILSRIPRNPK
jgi:hypothetical protein